MQLGMCLRLYVGKFKKSPELFLRMYIQQILNMFIHVSMVLRLRDHVLPLTSVGLRVKPEGRNIL